MRRDPGPRPVRSATEIAALVNAGELDPVAVVEEALERIEHAAEFPAALQRARTCGGPALIELITDSEALTPSASLSEIRDGAR